MTRGAGQPTDALLAAQPWQADPLADDTIARILGSWPEDSELPGAQAEQWQRIGCVNRLFATWADNAALTGWQAPPGTPDDIA